MDVIELTPDRNRFPKCSAKLSLVTRMLWKGHGGPQNEKGKDKCDCYASYKIDGKYFCRKHGGLYLLDKLSDLSGKEGK